MSNPDQEKAMTVTEMVTEMALGRLPDRRETGTPEIDFDFARVFQDYGSKRVRGASQQMAADEFLEAYRWCANRFPLQKRVDRRMVRSIDRVLIGQSLRPKELLSASSINAPGVVLFCAPWPLKSHYRIASLVAHESIHQALFVREIEATPVRSGSLGYSPWKRTLRDGRLVWHAFWTFACQYSFLSEEVLKGSEIPERDRTIWKFLAEMNSRLVLCEHSMREFAVVDNRELKRSRRAMGLVGGLTEKLEETPEFVSKIKSSWEVVIREYGDWAKNLAATQSTSNVRKRGIGRVKS